MDDSIGMNLAGDFQFELAGKVRQLEIRLDHAEHTLKLQDELFRLKQQSNNFAAVHGTTSAGATPQAST